MTKAKDPDTNLFFPDTRAERLGRRVGGPPRDVALQRAQAAVDKMQPDFDIWLGEEFETLNRAFDDMRRAPADKDAVERALHSAAQLRDVCGTMGYELVGFVARTLCDILEAFIAGAAYDENVVQCHVNAFALARLEPYRHCTPDQVPELAQGLLRVVEIASIVPGQSGK